MLVLAPFVQYPISVGSARYQPSGPVKWLPEVISNRVWASVAESKFHRRILLEFHLSAARDDHRIRARFPAVLEAGAAAAPKRPNPEKPRPHVPSDSTPASGASIRCNSRVGTDAIAGGST